MTVAAVNPSPAMRALLPAIVLVAALAYASAAPRWILGGDNGEFSTLYATGGIAHPPGYPSMVLWLRLWHWLPVAPAAYGAALATVVLGVMEVATLQRACLAWGASTASTGVASAVYAFSPLAWKMSSHAEVHAMNALFTVAILLIAAPEGRFRGTARVVILGVLAGVAVAAHQSIVLLAPIGLLAAVRAAREAKRPWVAVLAGVLALFAGLVPPYVYVYVVAKTADPRTTPMWIDGATWADVFFDFRRGSYGTLSLASYPQKGDALGNLLLFTRTITQQTLGMPVVVLLAAALALVKAKYRDIGTRERGSLVALAASFLLAGPIFIASFNMPFGGAATTVVERFYLMPEVILTVLAARLLDALLPTLMAGSRVALMLTAAVSVAASIVAVPDVREHNRPSVELYIENSLRAAPDDAIIVGTGDHRWGGFLYARYVLHLRPDVVCLVPDMLNEPWYRREAQARTGVSFETPKHTAVGPKTLLARLLATGRPVLYTDWPAPSVENTPHYSVGTLMRVLRDGESPPHPEALEALNDDAFSKYVIEPEVPRDPHGWGYGLQVDYARAWGELGEAYGREGNVAKEQECYRRAQTLAPWLVSAR